MNHADQLHAHEFLCRIDQSDRHHESRLHFLGRNEPDALVGDIDDSDRAEVFENGGREVALRVRVDWESFHCALIRLNLHVVARPRGGFGKRAM